MEDADAPRMEHRKASLPSSGEILVGITDDNATAAALRFACSAATTLALPIALVHVDATAVTGAPEARAGRRPAEAVARLLEDAATSARRALPPDAALTTEVLRGGVVRTLAERSGAAALLVVGRDDRVAAAVQSASIPAQLAMRAACPVAVVPAGWEPDDGTRPVTAAVDVPRWAGAILEQALLTAQTARRPLQVVHVTPPAASRQVWVPGHRYTRPSPGQRAENRRLLKAAVSRAAACYPDVPVEIVEEAGWPTTTLDDVAHRSALLVLGRHRQPRPSAHRLGVVTGHFVCGATCPTLVVEPQDMWAAAARSASDARVTAPG